MRLEGINHVTAITADASAAVEFYVGVLGLRLVKRTVNQDDPTAYHLFFGDETGSSGSDLTFFEYPGVARGRPGTGMVQRIAHRVADNDAIAFWDRRLTAAGVPVSRAGDALRFADPEGLQHELVVSAGPDEPLVARSAQIPAAFALRGFHGVAIAVPEPDAVAPFYADTLGLNRLGTDRWDARGEVRGGEVRVERSDTRGRMGAGAAHHVAFTTPDGDAIDRWRQRLLAAGAAPTPVVDRFYQRCMYFQEPGGVLFELATMGPGFLLDEDVETLGERLALPPRLAPRRAEIEQGLRPLPDVRAWRPTS